MTVVDTRSLNGTWAFRFDEESDWRSIPVPGCWEMLDVAKDRSGPAWYRTHAPIPEGWRGRRIWLRFGAVSYACTIIVNDRPVGSHIGLWDPFSVEITGAVEAGSIAEIVVHVEKPASLTCGPDSPAVPGAFPLRQTLSGFLPYVWGHIFGGLWQDVELVATGGTVFTDLHLRAAADGRLTIDASCSAPTDADLTVRDPGGAIVIDERIAIADRLAVERHVPAIQTWSPHSPRLYEARLRIVGGDERSVRFGARSLTIDGSTMMLNGRPIYPRLALSWGWYPDALHANPGPARVRADLERLRSLGYNGVKLCLWIPPPYYFELADELGMLLWVELPMWLPDPTPEFAAQTRREYERIVRSVRNHPSVFCYSLGCELNRSVGADLLEPLYTMVKMLGGDAPVRDNSGSGEAYGGLLEEHADYYDNHFYSDLPFLRPLLDGFAPRWRPQQPWLFGEFCDADTFRDLRRLGDDPAERPWWTANDPHSNPQGARWQFDLVEQEDRLRGNGFWDRGDDLERVSIEQALLHRKATLELVRAYREISGYVVTGEADTPISTAGMWDDSGELKFAPEGFRSFNGDLVLLVGWDKRRAWIAGGDRLAPWDSWSYSEGTVVRPHLIVSHYGASAGPAKLEWSIGFPGEAPFATGRIQTAGAIRPGTLRVLTVAEFVAPPVATPRRAMLRAAVTIGDDHASNEWPLWFFPTIAWDRLAGVDLIDPAGRLAGLARVAPSIGTGVQPATTVLIATAWTSEVESFLATGGCVLLLQAGSGPPGPLPAVALPFWREAVRIVDPHPAWGDFPHEGWAGVPFSGCATDHALVTEGTTVRPILRRLDARTMAVHDYAAELLLGSGRLIVTTLRFEGGLGDQPLGIERNTAAAYLLHCFVDALLRA